ARGIIAVATKGSRAVIVGASFIGLEVAAALTARGVNIEVVAHEPPFARVLGPELGAFLRGVHEGRGIKFHIPGQIAAIERGAVKLASGPKLAADFVVAGIGVRPDVGLASAAGLDVDDGILVNEHLESSVPGVFAAGDAARWRTASGERLRVEH